MDIAKFKTFLVQIFSSIFLTLLICYSAPLKWIFEYFTIYHPDLLRGKNNPDAHAKKVRRVQEQVREWIKGGRTKKLCTGRPGWQTMCMREIDKSKYYKIYMDLEDIIEIDTEKQTLRVEPGMKMGTLTFKLLSLGWTIPVVPELESLTIGGLINGAGIETSSHKYGLFSETCLEYELILSDGSLVTCSRNEKAELFNCIQMSYGTLGFLTAVTIKMIPAAKYVKQEYHWAKTIKEAEMLLQRPGYEFIEGITFDRDNSIIMLGNFSNDAEDSKINEVNKWYKPWFYKHVEIFLGSSKPSYEFIPLRDYYHRHQRPVFWLHSQIPYTSSMAYTLFFGWAYPVNLQILKFLLPKKVMEIGLMRRLFVQDFIVPVELLEQSMEFSHKEANIYPIWLCPATSMQTEGLVNPKRHEGQGFTTPLFVDIGIYGILDEEKRKNPLGLVRKFEKYAIQNNGYQGLYAESTMTYDEFRTMFDLSLYEKVRVAYDAAPAFPNVYQKICAKGRV